MLPIELVEGLPHLPLSLRMGASDVSHALGALGARMEPRRGSKRLPGLKLELGQYVGGANVLEILHDADAQLLGCGGYLVMEPPRGPDRCVFPVHPRDVSIHLLTRQRKRCHTDFCRNDLSQMRTLCSMLAWFLS